MAMESSDLSGAERNRDSARRHSLPRKASISFIGVVIAGTVGSYLGAAITYWVSSVVGRPVILRFGQVFLHSPDKLERAEVWLPVMRPAGFFSRGCFR